MLHKIEKHIIIKQRAEKYVNINHTYYTKDKLPYKDVFNF